MTLTSSTRHRRAAAVLGAALAAFALVMLGAVPATAHTELVRVSPADGERVGTDAPLTVSLTFTEALDPALADVVVVDEAGDVAPSPRTIVDDATVTHVLRDVLEAGPYVIRFRVVSGDGHPVTGESRFTVAAAEPAPGAEPTATPPVDDDTVPASASSEGTQDRGRTRLVLGAGTVALVLMAVAALANRRRTRASA